MSSRMLSYLLIRTLIFLVAAVVVAMLWHWPPFAGIGVAVIGAASLVQLGGVLYLRRTERNGTK